MAFSQQQTARRRKTLEILRRLRNLEKQPVQALEQASGAKLLRLLDHTQSSSWWRAHLGNNSRLLNSHTLAADILPELPILTRAKVQQNLDWMRIWIPNSEPDEYSEISTSGSTGLPVRVVQHLPRYLPAYSAIELLDLQWSGRDSNKNVGYFRITDPRTSKSAMPEPFSYLGGSGSVVYRNVLKLTSREMLQVIANEDVAYLSVNANVHRLLALEQLERPVKGVNLEQLISWADPVSSELRGLAARVFGARIIDRYSSSELGYLAVQCPVHDHLHAPQIQNYIEILDSANKPASRGELGRVVVTSLDNYSQPMIRYELGDMARWGETCSAGFSFPVIEPGIVRERELRHSADGTTLVPHPDGLTLVKSGGFIRYQVLEFTNQLVLLAEFSRKIEDAELEEAEQELAAQFGNATPARIVELPATQALLLSTWKNKRVLGFDHPAPVDLNVGELLALVPQYRPKEFS